VVLILTADTPEQFTTHNRLKVRSAEVEVLAAGKGGIVLMEQGAEAGGGAPAGAYQRRGDWSGAEIDARSGRAGDSGKKS